MYYKSTGLLSLIGAILISFIIFYGFILFLPVILILMGGYFIYVYYKAWRLKSYLQKQSYKFDFEDDARQADNIIDAEFEILDEKIRK
ncbi:MAG: hypothetical protein IJ545_08320 [Alphaproteobacteria bacterium]|nr:hypothetical protein [Alphaproteobacteria bacterium]